MVTRFSVRIWDGADASVVSSGVNVNGATVCLIQLSGVASGSNSVIFQGKVGTKDDVNWDSIGATLVTGSTVAANATVDGIYRLEVAGLAEIRLNPDLQAGGITADARFTDQ
jgi:hypothetical protein